jgi:hypothetical protein
VDTPGLFDEKGGFAAVAGVWLLELAGWPTACALSGAQLSPGTKGSLTASAVELTAPTTSAEVASTATILFTLLYIPSLRSLSLPGYLRTPGQVWFDAKRPGHPEGCPGPVCTLYALAAQPPKVAIDGGAV